MDDITRLQGPIEMVAGQLTLLIPLEAGGEQFLECARGISEVQGEYLKIIIPEWLSGMLRIKEGSLVSVDNENGKFNIHPINPDPIQ